MLNRCVRSRVRGGRGGVRTPDDAEENLTLSLSRKEKIKKGGKERSRESFQEILKTEMAGGPSK
jgi:hypothetical protein